MSEHNLEERIKRLERELPREVLYKNQRAPLFVDLSGIMDEVQRNRSEVIACQRNLNKLSQDTQEALKVLENTTANRVGGLGNRVEGNQRSIGACQEQIDRLEERIKGMELMAKFLELDPDKMARLEQAMRYLEAPPVAEDDEE